MFNSYPTFENLKNLSKDYEYIKQLKIHKNQNGEDNFVAIYKWSIILHVFEKYFNDKKDLKILDLGGGYNTWLTNYFTKYGEVTNIDLMGSAAYSRAKDKIIDESIHNIDQLRSKNLKTIVGDFLIEGKKLPNDYFDFIYDGCSIIHFNPKKKDYFQNYGIYQTGLILNRILKRNGIFISSSHCSHPNFYQVRDMVFPENILNSFVSAGLDPLLKPNLIPNEYFKTQIKNYNCFTNFEFDKIINNAKSSKSLDILYERSEGRDFTLLITINFLLTKGKNTSKKRDKQNNVKQNYNLLIAKIKKKYLKLFAKRLNKT